MTILVDVVSVDYGCYATRKDLPSPACARAVERELNSMPLDRPRQDQTDRRRAAWEEPRDGRPPAILRTRRKTRETIPSSSVPG